MAGFGAYGGSELSNVWDKMGGWSGAANASKIAKDTGVSTVGLAPESTGNLLTAAPYNPALVSQPVASTGINTGLNIQGTYPSMLQSKPIVSTGVGSTITPTATNQGTFWERLSKSIGTPEQPASPGQVALKVAPTAVQAAEGAGLFDEPTYTNQYGSRMKRVPTGTYDAKGNAEYTYVPAESYASAETLNLNDPYANYSYIKPVPQLKLAAKGGEINSYALGGAVTTNPSSGAGISDLYNRPEGQTLENLSQDGYGIGRLNNLANAEAMNTARVTGYADGGVASLELNDKTAPATEQVMTPETSVLNEAAKTQSHENEMNKLGLGALNTGNVPTNNYAPGSLATLANAMKNQPIPPEASFIPNLTAARTGYARGGYLDGQGDGMSDSIPATIEGKQPARLADGEFVVSADVVSHLGNGSTKAGAKKLYKMMDKVRLARTGTKKQGRQINADKYLPKVA